MAALRGKALIAYILVCVIWGSTYAAIRVGVAEFPALMFSGVRFLIAGAVLLVAAVALGGRLPRRAEDWRTLAVVGILTLSGGNGFVVWAEQYTESGIASVFVTTVALWMAIIDALYPGSKSKLGPRVVTGLAVGFLGSLLLVGATPREILAADLRGPVALTVASASWALGSVYSKRHPVETGAYVTSSVQMLVGGGFNTLLALMLGQTLAWPPSRDGALALGYLIIFGSIIGYSAYAYLLRAASPTIVGTYAYVNPVVAISIGWLLLGESVTPRAMLAMGLILGAVVWIQLSPTRALKRASSRVSQRVDAGDRSAPCPAAATGGHS